MKNRSNDINRTDDRDRRALDFLTGSGPNPISESRREAAGPLTRQFMRETADEVAEQDRANQRKAEPNAMDDLMAALRLVSDNRDLIQHIESGKFGSVSALAVAMERELPNVSRTLSRMAAYGLVGYEEPEGDARAKKPVWLAPALSNHDDIDWVQAYCFAMALKKQNAVRLDEVHFTQMESVVREAVADAAEKIDMLLSPTRTGT